MKNFINNFKKFSSLDQIVLGGLIALTVAATLNIAAMMYNMVLIW